MRSPRSTAWRMRSRARSMSRRASGSWTAPSAGWSRRSASAASTAPRWRSTPHSTLLKPAGGSSPGRRGRRHSSGTLTPWPVNERARAPRARWTDNDLLCSALALHHARNDGDVDQLALVGLVRAIEQVHPNGKRNAQADNGDAEHEPQDDLDDPQHERLHVVRLDERALLLILPEQKDDGHKRGGDIGKSRPQSIVACRFRCAHRRHGSLSLCRNAGLQDGPIVRRPAQAASPPYVTPAARERCCLDIALC